MWVTQGQQFTPLWESIHLLLLAFPTSHIMEQGFSQAPQLQTKYQNRLNLMSSGALRLKLKLKAMSPDVKKVAAAHQVLGSH